MLNPRACGRPELKLEISRARSLALVTSKPKALSRPMERALRSFMPAFPASPDVSHTPRLPTYAVSSTRFLVSSRCNEMLHWLIRGGRAPLGSIQAGGELTVPGCGRMPGSSDTAKISAVLYWNPLEKAVTGVPKVDSEKFSVLVPTPIETQLEPG